MAKIIRLTPEIIEGIREEFDRELKSARLSDGKISFTKSLTSEKASAVIRYSEKAWLKQTALISGYDKEVAWHGIARRGDDESANEYFIDDILIYPQKVSGATVETDQAEYQTWLLSQGPDVMRSIRMQGHSHVNMSTSPSGTDTGYYREILDQLTNEMFYIFMIWNKRGEKTVLLYDMKKNILFETADCTVMVDDGEIGIQKLMNDAKTMVKGKVWTYQQPYSWNSGAKKDEPKTPAVVSASEKKEEKKDEPKAPVVAAKPAKKGKRKGKRPAAQTSLYDMAYDDDDYDDPYGPFGWRDSWR